STSRRLIVSLSAVEVTETEDANALPILDQGRTVRISGGRPSESPPPNPLLRRLTTRVTDHSAVSEAESEARAASTSAALQRLAPQLPTDRHLGSFSTG